MNFLPRLITLLLIFTVFPHRAEGFVFLNARKPRLLPEDGRNQFFHLTSRSPVFTDRQSFEDGIYAERSDDETFVLLVERAMLIWNQIPGLGIQLKVASERTGTIDQSDNTFSIGISPISSVASGLAFPVADELQVSKIRDCDIQVGTDIDSIPSFVFVMVHELGHCLGLGHNHSDPSAIMGYWQPRTEVALGLDDMAGALSLYPPPDSSPVKNFAPCGVIAASVNHELPSAFGKSPKVVFRENSAIFLLLAGIFIPIIFLVLNNLRPLSFRRRQQVSDQSRSCRHRKQEIQPSEQSQ